MLPQLAANISANASVLGSGRSSDVHEVQVWPLSWGEPESASEVIRSCDEAFNDGGRFTRRCDLIVAADVVYHEHLIDPLISSLASLTAPGSGLVTVAHGTDGAPRAPPILISYVQRFKRAKRFFTKARKWFTVEEVHVDPVVDYDVLNWNRGKRVCDVSSGSAGWKVFADGMADPPVACAAAHFVLIRK